MTDAVPFTEALKDVSAGNAKILQRDLLPIGPLAVVDQGQETVAGYTDRSDAAVHSTAPLIVFGDHTRTVKFIDFPFAMGADGVKVLQAREGFESKFLYHYLQFREIPHAGYSRHFKFLKELEIPRPSLAEQRRIAAILDQADNLRAKRRQVLAHLDSLTQSIFHEMFEGTPLSRVRLGHLVTIRSSLVMPDPTSMRDVPHVGPDSLESGTGIISGWRTVGEDGVTSGKYRFQPGDVLYSKIRPNLNKVATASFGGLCSADMYALVPNETVVVAAYVEHALRSPGFLSYANSLSNRANIPKLNRNQLESFEAPLPSLTLQREFAASVERVNRQRAAAQGALAADDELFASLQSRAFSGSL